MIVRHFGSATRCLLLAVAVFFVAGNAVARYHVDPPPDDAPVSIAVPAVSHWVARREYAGVVYFLFSAPARIERYDTTAGAWLPVIGLTGPATAFDVDASGIYDSESDGVHHFDLSGAALGVLPNVPGAQVFLYAINTFVLTGSNDLVNSYDKVSGTHIDTLSTFFELNGYSVIPSEGRLFGEDVGVSPSDILSVTFDAQSGELISSVDSPYHGALPYAVTTYAREAGGMVIDNMGTVYSTADLIYLGSLGGSIQGIAYLADSFVVMRGATLARFSYDLRELGQMEPPFALVDIIAVNDTLYAITSTGGSLAFAPVALDAFQSPAPPSARPWSDTAGRADAILGDASQLLFMAQYEHAIYPFHPDTWTYGDPVPLYVSPLFAAYSPVTQNIYASYDGGAIYAFPLQQPGTAAYLSSTVYSANGLATADEFVFAADPSGAWESHFTFSPDGTRLSWVDWNYYSRQFEWDPNRRRMYFFRDDTSPNDLHWEEIASDGTIADEGESPYHGEVIAMTPIRVSPDGAAIVIGSGQVFDAGDLSIIGDLGHTMSDIAWSSGDLYGLDTEQPAQFLRFSPSYSVVSSGHVRGTPRRLLPNGSNFLYVADVGATTIVGVLDAFVSKADLAVDPVALGLLFAGGSTLSFDVTVGNNGSVPSNGAHVSGDLSMLEDATWQCIADIGVSGCDDNVHASPDLTSDLDLADGGQVHFHVTGRVPADAVNKLAIPFEITPANPASDPELRNNASLVRVRLDGLFRCTFDFD